MKITRLSEYDIRCVLTEEELSGYGINLDDILEKSEKTKKFFRDILSQAVQILDMKRANGIHMASAQITVMQDNSISIIFHEASLDDALRKISGGDEEKAEELKNRLEKEITVQSEKQGPELSIAMRREILDIMEEQLRLGGNASAEAMSELKSLRAELDREEQELNDKPRSFVAVFDNLEKVISYCSTVRSAGSVISRLYKSAKDGKYYLFVLNYRMDTKVYQGLRMMVNEFGSIASMSAAGRSHLIESSEVIIEEDAFKHLASLAAPV